MRYFYLVLLLFINAASFGQIVINEVDSDSPGVDDREFIELKSATPFFALDGYVLVFYNGSPTSSTANLSYFNVDLDGYVTDINGIITIGSITTSPVPQIIISQNVIQNGEDGVALYQGNSFDFPVGTLATTSNLIDAVVYGTGDPDALDLMALLGESQQYDENQNAQASSQSIQRKNDGTYEVKNPTPGANNDGSGFIYNGLTITVSATTIPEGNVLQITVTAQQPVTEAVSLPLALEDEFFTLLDFSGSPVIEIPAGGTQGSVQLQIVDDTVDEGDELLTIRFSAIPQLFTRLNDALEVRIIDNDWTIAPWGTPLNPTYGQVVSTAPPGYYATLEGKAGSELKQAIQAIIADPSTVREHTYGDAEIILKQADQNPQNSNEVWLMYVEQGRAKYKFQTTSSSVGFWNREHIFPQSRGGFTNGTSAVADGFDVWDTTDAGDIAAGHSDAHHLRAEDGPENSSRNNRDYGTDYNGPAGNSGSWKGDVARALFYMAVRYNGLQLVNGNPPDNTLGEMADLQSLLTWNVTDPSDDFEMNRNNIIYEWQRNRNPFIDYPLLADYIWGANAGQPWSFSLGVNESEVSDVRFYPNPAQEQITVVTSTPVQVVISDMSGKVLSEQNITNSRSIPLQLSSGIYVVRFSNSAGTIIQKLIVQ